jgi:hypothetical protein
MRVALALLGLGLALASFSGEAAEGILDAQGALLGDDNLSRAVADTDIVADTALNLAVSGGVRFALDDGEAVILTGDLRTWQFRQFHGLNSAALGGSASWRRKFGVGPFVPWTSVSASFSREWYEESIRNGLRGNLVLRAGQRMSESLELSGGGGFDRYLADDVVPVQIPGVAMSGDAFSVTGSSLFARADYAIDERWLAFAGVTARRGDVTASTRRDPEILSYSTAVTRDPVFGSDYVAYRISATTWTFTAGVSLAMNGHSSLNLAATRAFTYATGDIDYRYTQFSASVLLNY